MKSVKDFIYEIASLGLNHDIVGDTEQEEIVLNYLNLVYNEVITSQYAKSEPRFTKVTQVPVTDGISTFVESNYGVMSVIDLDNKTRLQLSDYEDLEDRNVLMDDTGNPTHYYFVGNNLYTYPKNNTTIKVRYLQKQTPLTLDTDMDDVLIPSEYHAVLLWGTLYYLAFDERDFSFQVNSQVCGNNYRIQKSKLISNAYYRKQKPDSISESNYLEG